MKHYKIKFIKDGKLFIDMIKSYSEKYIRYLYERKNINIISIKKN